jgi:hypothetical protein
MLYVQQSLAADEELVHVGNFHWIYTVQAVLSIVWGLLICLLILFGAVYLQLELGLSFSDNGPREGAGVFENIRSLHPGVRLLAFFIFLLGLFRFAQMMVVKATTEIAVTTNRLIYKRGLIARRVGEISIDRIEGVNVLQGIIGRLLNYGRVMVRGMGVGEVTLPPIEDPVGFRKAIDKARSL